MLRTTALLSLLRGRAAPLQMLRSPLRLSAAAAGSSSAPLLCVQRYASTTPAVSPAHGAGRGAGSSVFRAPPNIGPGRAGEPDVANPFKAWGHMSHTWLILMCAGCLCAGLLAGHFVEVDETKLKPNFSKLDLIESAAKQYEFRPDLAATSIRVAFVLAARRSGVPAEFMDESCAVSDGLVDMAGVLNFLGTTYGATMEDAVSLAAIAGVKYLHGPYETMLEEWQWGRNDTEAAPERNVPVDPTHKIFSIPTILRGLGDLSDEECVALMACHSVGEFHENVSGIEDATHIGSRYTLSNAYYKFLLANEKRKFFPLDVQRTEDNKDLKVLPTTLVCHYADAPKKAAGKDAGAAAKKQRKRACVFNKAELDVMLKGKTWRPIVERFASDEAAWEACFQTAFTRMINGHFKKLRVYTEPDAKSA